MNIDDLSPSRVKFIKILLPVSILIFAYHAISMSLQLNWYYEDPIMLGWGWVAFLLWLCLKKWSLLILNILALLPIILFVIYTIIDEEKSNSPPPQINTIENYIDNLAGSPSYFSRKSITSPVSWHSKQ